MTWVHRTLDGALETVKSVVEDAHPGDKATLRADHEQFLRDVRDPAFATDGRGMATLDTSKGNELVRLRHEALLG